MTALAQGSAGLALVMGFALLATGQVTAAAVLLAIQSGAVAVTAVALHQPLLAIPPLILGAGTWLLQHETPDPRTIAMGGVKPGVAIGAVLAILCQSLGILALPSAIVLLSILLAATRSHKSMQVVALVALQNGLALAGSLVAGPENLPAALIFPLACLALPLPLAVALLVSGVPLVSGAGMSGSSPDLTRESVWSATSWGAVRSKVVGDRAEPGHDTNGPGRGTNETGRSTNERGQDTNERDHDTNAPSHDAKKVIVGPVAASAAPLRFGRSVPWLGWIDLGLALAIAAATLIVPLNSLAAVFAPLLALDGVLRSWMRRNRDALTLLRRGGVLAQTGFTLLAVCAPDLETAWLAVLAAMTLALLPTLSRCWSGAVLAFLAAGLALFGMPLLPATPPVLGWFSLFAGFATIAAIVPDLAVVFVILILRLANQAPWPSGVEALGIGIAVIALLACSALLTNRVRPHRTALLVLSQASIAVLTICTGQADGRFAALVLLVLLILCRAAARVIDGPAGTLATTGLAGILPFGLFPGLVLAVLALGGYKPWLLLPIGVVLVPIVLTSVPRRIADFAPRTKIPSIAWLPLVLAILAGYFAPDGLVHWWRVLTAGSP